jgi:hypothetical protein
MLIVSRALKFAALYPDHLNLNGDHANLLVLQKRLEWRGVNSEIVSVERPTNLNEFDFVLLGHGSDAAWAEVLKIDSKMLNNIVDLVRSGSNVLAIASGYQKLHELLNQKAAVQIERVSEFKSFEGVVGYVNTEFDLPEMSRVENSVLTLFHGPVLAKNPQLADEIIANANWADVSLTSDKFDEVEKLAEASRQIAFDD